MESCSQTPSQLPAHLPACGQTMECSVKSSGSRSRRSSRCTQTLNELLPLFSAARDPKDMTSLPDLIYHRAGSLVEQRGGCVQKLCCTLLRVDIYSWRSCSNTVVRASAEFELVAKKVLYLFSKHDWTESGSPWQKRYLPCLWKRKRKWLIALRLFSCPFLLNPLRKLWAYGWLREKNVRRLAVSPHFLSNHAEKVTHLCLFPSTNQTSISDNNSWIRFKIEFTLSSSSAVIVCSKARGMLLLFSKILPIVFVMPMD